MVVSRIVIAWPGLRMRDVLEAYRKKCRKIGEGGDGGGSGNGCPGDICHVLFVTPNVLLSLRQYETPEVVAWLIDR